MSLKVLMISMLFVFGGCGKSDEYLDGFKAGAKAAAEKVVYYPTNDTASIVFDTIGGNVYGIRIDSTVSNAVIIGFHLDYTGVQIVRDTVYVENMK